MALLLGLFLIGRLPADEGAPIPPFGFNSLEIYKVSYRSGNLLSGDLNGDGLNDLVIVDNSNSRIDLFQQRPRDAAPDETSASRNVNELTNHGRFEHRKLSVEREVSSMALGDFNADGRTDIVYIGVPDRLEFKLQLENGQFESKSELRLPGVSQSSWAIAVGDLNGDGKDDLVVLGTTETFVLLQTQTGFGQPERLLNTSDRLAVVQIADLDGDGRNDICYLADSGQERLLCARLQSASGRLGPELQFDVKRQRSLTLSEIDGEPGRELLSIDPLTSRVKVSRLRRPQADAGGLAGRLVQYGFGGLEGSRDRDIALGDLSGDGRAELIATDPAGARVYLFRQNEDGLDLGTPFASLQGASQVRVGKTRTDGPAEVYVLSTKEKAIGVSRLEDDRLTIPQVLPIQGEPVAIELADLDSDGAAEVIYIGREREGRSSNYTLRALRRMENEEWAPYPFDGAATFDLKTTSTPERIRTADVNRDGKPDFLISQGSDRPLLLLLGTDQGSVKIVEPESGFKLGSVPPGALFFGSPDEPRVLVAQDNFVRSFRLNEKSQWELLEQFNASEPNAKIAGAAALDLDNAPGDEIVLVDTGVSRLRVLKQSDGEYAPWKEVELGAFPFVSSHVADLNRDGRDDLLLFGGSRFAVLYAGRTDPELQEVASFETELEKVFFADIVAGDLNGDGRPDLAVLDTRSHYVEILHFNSETGLRRGLHFKIFEEKNFQENSEASGTDPREGVIADVTGDGLKDLILLVHDRILVYPQDGPQ